jgi:ribonucleotide reductase beta subunit family protein with ferritin-like domain
LWTSEEIDTALDVHDYNKLSPPEQAFVKQILAFFASADLIVLDNLMEQFGTEVCAYDLKLFFVVQAYIEAVHSETYSNLLTAIVKDPTEQHQLFDAINTFPSIQSKINWMQYWTNSEARTFAERLIAFAAVEGIFFSGAFCAVFWLKKRGLLPGLSFANELISRDEGLHRDFAVYINNKRLLYPAPPLTVRRIIESAVEIETNFITNALPVALIGMNADQMTLYIKFVADHLLISLRQPKLYNVKNPYEWMDMISLQGKTNFFEKRVGEYALSGVASTEPKHDFDLDTSF